MHKPVALLGMAAVRARLKKLNALDELSTEQQAERKQLWAREWALDREKRPPVKTPPNFIEKELDW